MEVIPYNQTQAIMPTQLVVCPHPILAAAGREIINVEFLPRESIQAYLDRQNVKLGRQPWLLEVNGYPVPRDWWGRVYPKPGTLITLRATVQKGGGGGKNPLQTVLSIALMVVAPGIGDMLALAMMGGAATVMGMGVMAWSAIMGGVVAVAGSLIIDGLVGTPAPQLSQVNGSVQEEQVSPTYSLSGGSNRVRLFEPLSLIVGRHRVFPDSASKSYTEFDGEDQYLYQAFHFGIGTTTDLVLTDFSIGDTPISSYTDVEITEAGSDGRLPVGNVDSLAGGALTFDAGWITRTSSADSTELAVDIQGQLYQINDAGSVVGLSCQIQAEYRLVGDPGWTAWKDETLSNASRKPIRLTWRKTVTQGQYEVRVKKVTADTTSPRQIAEFSFLQLKSYQPDLADYTGQRRVLVRIKATGQLQGSVDQFNAIAQRKVLVPTGPSTWAVQATSNPAWLYLWFVRGGSISGRLAFGVGLGDTRIDIEGIKEWGAWCTTKGLTFDAIFDSARSRADILNTISRCGRASPSWAKGTLGVVWDAADLPHVAVFGHHNIIANSFQIEYATEALADEVVLNFINPDNGWKQDSVRVTVPGFAEGYVPQRPVTVELFGCANKVMAGAECNLVAASQRYHRKRIKWEADFEGLVAQRGDVVILSHDLTQWGFSGRLVSATDTVLTLDRMVSYSSGSPYIMVTSPAGESVIRAVTAFVGEADTLTLVSALPWDPSADAENPVVDYSFVFDPLETPGRRVKIVGVPKITGAGQRVQYEAINDDSDYYASESNPYTWVSPTRLIPVAPSISNLAVVEELIRSGTGYAVKLHITWTASGNYDHAAILAGEESVTPWFRGTSIGNHYELTVADALQDITIKVVALDGAGRTDPVTGNASITHSIQGKALHPSDLTDLTVTVDEEGALLAWPGIPDADFDTYEIRSTDADWGLDGYVARIASTQWRPTNVISGVNTWFIKARDTSGNYADSARSVQLTVTAAPATIIRAEVLHNNVLLSYDAVAGTLPTATYELRRGAIYGSAEIVGTKSGLFTFVFETSADSYTYWITAIDKAGNYGTPASVTVLVSAPPNYVLKANYFSLFTGTFSNSFLENYRVVLPANITETFAGHFTTGGWATPQDQVDAGYPLYIQPGVASGYYEEIFDYGTVLAANKISVGLTAAAITGSVTFTTDIHVSVDSVTWVSYLNTDQVYATNFRYAKVRVNATATGGAVGEITSLNVRLDSTPKSITGTLSCLSSDSGGTVLYLTDDRTSGGVKEFIDVDSVTLTVAATSALIATYDFTDTPNPLSLKVLLFDAAGARVSGTCSYTIQGT